MGDTTENALLLALGEMVRKEVSAEAMLHGIVDVMTRELNADRGTVFAVDDEADELVCIAAHLPEIDSLRVPRTQGVAGYVARTGSLVNIPHADDDARFWKEVDARTGYQTRSMLAGPLYNRAGSLVGVAQFLNKHDGDFDADDEATFERLADQVARLLEGTTLGSVRDLAASGASRTVPVEARAADGEIPDPAPPIGDRINRIVGTSAAMRTVFSNIRRVAPTDATVLLRGESGTGKGLVARALHHNSSRGDGAFVHVDCTTLPEGLMESELFGHERGAFTGAERRRDGKVAKAEGGTLFLDEIGDLPPALQGKLLTLVQDHRYSRVGGSDALEADIRIVAATNRNLETLVETGRFREDLYYRLRVVELELPPLRDRGETDLRMLINHFVAEASRRHDRPVERIAPDALELLLRYPWPGNVRELQNCLESAVIFSDGEITQAMLALPRSRRLAPDNSERAGLEEPAPFADEPTLSELEGRYIAWLLARHDNNRSACARVLDIGRNTLLRKIRQHGLDG